MKDQIDLINEFLDGNLLGKELKTFQAEMASDSALADKVKVMRGLRAAVTIDKTELAKEKELKKKLSQLGDKHFKKTPQPVAKETTTGKVEAKRRSIFPKLAAAASVALLILGATYFMKSDPLDVDKLLSANVVKTYAGSERSAKTEAILPGNEMANINANMEKAAEKADEFFDNKQYDKAKTIYNSLLAKHNDPISKAIYNGNKINWEAMIWNAALVEVGLGNMEEAKKQLTAILKSDISKKYKGRAEAVLERLD